MEEPNIDDKIKELIDEAAKALRPTVIVNDCDFNQKYDPQDVKLIKNIGLAARDQANANIELSKAIHEMAKSVAGSTPTIQIDPLGSLRKSKP